MQVLVFSVAAAACIAMTGSGFAGDVTKAATKAGCEKAGGMWDAQNYKCAEDSAKMGKGEGTHEHSQSTPEHDTQKIDQPERRNPTTDN